MNASGIKKITVKEKTYELDSLYSTSKTEESVFSIRTIDSDLPFEGKDIAKIYTVDDKKIIYFKNGNFDCCGFSEAFSLRLKKLKCQSTPCVNSVYTGGGEKGCMITSESGSVILYQNGFCEKSYLSGDVACLFEGRIFIEKDGKIVCGKPFDTKNLRTSFIPSFQMFADESVYGKCLKTGVIGEKLYFIFERNISVFFFDKTGGRLVDIVTPKLNIENNSLAFSGDKAYFVNNGKFYSFDGDKIKYINTELENFDKLKCLSVSFNSDTYCLSFSSDNGKFSYIYDVAAKNRLVTGYYAFLCEEEGYVFDERDNKIKRIEGCRKSSSVQGNLSCETDLNSCLIKAITGYETCVNGTADMTIIGSYGSYVTKLKSGCNYGRCNVMAEKAKITFTNQTDDFYVKRALLKYRICGG